MNDSLFTLYINHPTRKCRLHRTSCTYFRKRKKEVPLIHKSESWNIAGNGFWVRESALNDILILREKMKNHPKWGKYKYDECTKCLPLYQL